MNVIDRIRERRDAATSGPYYPSVSGDIVQEWTKQRVATCYWKAPDASFLAHSWEDIGTLLAIVEKAGEMEKASARLLVAVEQLGIFPDGVVARELRAAHAAYREAVK